ncbi:WXG100 family type VII secretion target [Helicobacter cetorum]|uniref:WXG100 family type VII secretion target n=1 Tax=Helicobacter cetorum TaxID=138563 RepID=UPI000CF0FF5B|nr:WXG100 family type VII secretion target [Helicobacter cetorum]
MDVHVNADELEKFVGEVKGFLETQQNATSRLKGAFNRLGNSWQDSKRKEFENNFSNLLNALARFNELAQGDINHLRKLIAIQREYERTHHSH